MFADVDVSQVAERSNLAEHEIDEIRSLSEICLPLSTISVVMKLPLAFLIHLSKTDERVQDAIYTGRAKAEKNIATMLFRSALCGNVAAAIWIEKTRFGRCEPPRMINSIDEIKELTAG